jgi:hypothetical protein
MCAAFVRVVPTTGARRIANVLLAVNVVAQSCCNYAVVTRDQMGHVVEESIWALSATMMIAEIFLFYRWAEWQAQPRANRAFLRGALLAGPLYVLFMVTVDVPMYVQRALADHAAGTVYLGFAAGIAEMAKCSRVTNVDAFWTAEMPWMSLYFTFAVWAALWVAFSDIRPGALVPKVLFGTSPSAVARKMQ